MCLAPRRLSPWQEPGCHGLLVWLRGVEVGPPNLLQVQGDGGVGGVVVGIIIWQNLVGHSEVLDWRVDERVLKQCKV